MKATLVQILLNTLEPNTQIVKDSQVKLEQSETSPDYPLLLGEIICEAQNHPKQLDLIAVLALSKCIRTRYASHDEENQMKICHMMMKLLETVVNPKVMNEIILIFRQIVIIEFPGGVSFKVILDNFTESKLSDLDKLLPYRKFIYLKLFYKCARGIHREKASRNNEQLHYFKTMLDQQASQCLISLMRQLMNDLSVLGNQLEALKNGSVEQVETGLVEIFTKIRYSFFLDSAKYVFKIYSFYNLISKYSPLGDFNVVVIARHFHQIYSNIANIIISSGLINKLQTTKELENITNLIHVAEKHLMESVDHRIVKIEDLEVIFDHFVATYFSNTDHLIFYGEKFVDYQQLSSSEYLKMVCETEIYSKMKFFEEKLLINCINTLSGILENFGDDNTFEDGSQEMGGSIKKFFGPKLEMVLKKLLNQMFLIDVNDLYKLKLDSEEYYESINHIGDEDCQLREAGKKFLQNIHDHLDREVIVKLCVAMQNELITSPPENIRDFKQLLKRESIYYLLNKLFAQAKNDINYDAFLVHSLNTDLKIQDKNFDIVKIQLLLLVQLHVQKAYIIEENLSKEIFSIVYGLISQQNPSNICLVLIALKILLHLIEIKPDFSSLIPEIALSIFSLCKQVSYMESKLTIFEFFEYSIVGNFPEYYQVIWEICEGSYKACKDTSHETINLKSKIINIIIKLIESTEIEYQRVPFIADILQEGIQDSDTFDETLMQGCYNLFGKLLMRLNFAELSNETISKLASTVQIICTIMVKRFEYIPVSVVILENCLIAPVPVLHQTIGKSLVEGMIIWLSDLKENVLKFFFDMSELYLMSSKENRAEFVLNIVEKVLTFANSENNTSPVIGIYLSNLMRTLARLAFEDVESLYAALNSLSQKHGTTDFKYTLLAKFYDYVREETVSSSYYAKKSFCFYTFAILALYLKELEANNGIDFNKIALSHNNVFQTDFKSLVQIFCRCLAELYEYDSADTDSITPEIYANLAELFTEDDYLIGNEFNVDNYLGLLQVLAQDPMRKFNIYSEVKNMLSKSQVILNDNECKAIIEKEIKF